MTLYLPFFILSPIKPIQTNLRDTGKVGHLYPSGDYAEAARLIRGLIQDPASCKAMAAAGRAEVEKFGWSAATKVLREQQYSRAIKVNSFKQRSAVCFPLGRRTQLSYLLFRFRFMAIRVGLGRILKMIWMWIEGLFQRIILTLDYARGMRMSASSSS